MPYFEKHLRLRITPELEKKLEKLSKLEKERNKSDFVRRILERYCRRAEARLQK